MIKARPQKRGRKVAIIGVPMDLGSNLRGVDMGPSAIRIAGVEERLKSLGCRIEDLGNLAVPHASVAGGGSSQMRFAKAICAACELLATSVEGAIRSGSTPVVLGGDHTIAMGTLAGLQRAARAPKKARGASRAGKGGAASRSKSWGLLWVDAHADCNTPQTTPSGNVHGMPLAAVLGLGDPCFTQLGGAAPMVDPARAALVGARALDARERSNIRELGLRVYTMREIDERGVHGVMKEALDIVTKDTDGFHVSFDIDCIDPRLAPGVGTPADGGLTVREAHLIMEMVADTGAMVSCEIVEVNPVIDQGNTTAELAAGLVHSALGGRIL